MNATQAEIRAVLRDARALIATPGKWTKGANGRRANGLAVADSSLSNKAVVSRCAVGAILAAGPIAEVLRGPSLAAANARLRNSIKRHTGQCLNGMAVWNDAPERTHADVMQAFDWAIADAADDSAA